MTTQCPKRSLKLLWSFFIGNICRSPIAEAVMIDTVSKQGLSDKFEIDSAAIGSWHVGRKPEHRAQSTMKSHNLAYSNTARQVLDPIDQSDLQYPNPLHILSFR